MTKQVAEFLSAFDALSPSEKHAAAVEVLRRSVEIAPDSLTDEELIAAADELFQEFDEREANDARP